MGKVQTSWGIGPDGVWVPSGKHPIVDLRFDGHRVWSFRPDRDIDRDGLVAWPPPLRSYLTGQTQWSLHDHATGRELATGDVAFGDAPGRVEIVDGDGGRLTVNKRGLLRRMFEGADDATRGRLVDLLNAVVQDLREIAGAEAFVCFGSLLGAIREGGLIGHDNDTDLVVLSGSSYPVDVAMESYRYERVLRRRGWRTTRTSAGNFKVHLRLPNGMEPATDVFSGWYAGDTLHLMPSTIVQVPSSALLPVGTARLEGRQVVVPRDPERLLRAIYGDGWRIPDPTFRYERPAATIRRFTGWMRGDHTGQRQWETYYLARSDDGSGGPSAFARWAFRQGDPLPMLDLGCGLGRDAVWFARQGVTVTAVDHVRRALAVTERRARRRGVHVDTVHLSLCDTRAILGYGGSLAHRRAPRNAYARGLLESLAPHGRQNLWVLLRMTLRRGGRAYIGLERRPALGRAVDLDVTCREIEAAGGTVEDRAPATPETDGRIVTRWEGVR